VTSQTLRIKRQTNGTIDIDHYRGRALAERKAVMAASLRGAFPRGWRLLAALAPLAAGATAKPPATQASTTGVTLASR
jgi:hypothetical protein